MAEKKSCPDCGNEMNQVIEDIYSCSHCGKSGTLEIEIGTNKISLRSEEEIRLKIQKIEKSGEMCFGDENGGYERGKHDALLWVLKEYEGEI